MAGTHKSLKVPFLLKHPQRQRKTWIQELQEGSLPLKSATQLYIEGLLLSGCNMTEFTLNRLRNLKWLPYVATLAAARQTFFVLHCGSMIPFLGDEGHCHLRVFASATLALSIPRQENPNPGWTMKRALLHVEKSTKIKSAKSRETKTVFLVSLPAFQFTSEIMENLTGRRVWKDLFLCAFPWLDVGGWLS